MFSANSENLHFMLLDNCEFLVNLSGIFMENFPTLQAYPLLP